MGGIIPKGRCYDRDDCLGFHQMALLNCWDLEHANSITSYWTDSNHRKQTVPQTTKPDAMKGFILELHLKAY